MEATSGYFMFTSGNTSPTAYSMPRRFSPTTNCTPSKPRLRIYRKKFLNFPYFFIVLLDMSIFSLHIQIHPTIVLSYFRGWLLSNVHFSRNSSLSRGLLYTKKWEGVLPSPTSLFSESTGSIQHN